MTLLDRAHFDHMTGHDRALQVEIAELFRVQADAWAGACNGAEGWATAVHTLKGSARGIGLAALAAACEAAEKAPDIARAEALAKVRAALAEALVALEQFAAEAGLGFSR